MRVNAPLPTTTSFSESLMRNALLGAGTSVWEWHVTSGRLTNVDTSAALLGFDPGELESTQEAWNRVIHPDDADANHEAYLRHARGELPLYEHEYRAICKDGSVRWIQERGRIVERDAEGAPLRMVGTLSDVTERRLAEAERQESAERLHKLARHVPGVLYQFRTLPDGSGMFPYVSESALPVFGIPAEMLMNDAGAVLRLIDREDRQSMADNVAESIRTMRTWRQEFRLHLPARGLRWIAASATPQREADGTVLWHGYMQDVTELRALEEAGREAERAQAASRAKTEFLSRMSHELRTPLNAVLGFAQLLEIDAREPLTPLQARRVGLIREAGAHLLQMIGELLDLTRIEAGQLAVRLEPVTLAPFLQEAVDLLRPQADEAGVSLAVAADTVPLGVQADPVRLRQVLWNLVGNAVKYNRRGGTVTLHGVSDGERVCIVVADTGIGIAPEHLATLFEPFQRGAHVHSTIEGAGIGLAFSRALAGLMHGGITAESTLGVGSRFTLTLPAATL